VKKLPGESPSPLDLIRVHFANLSAPRMERTRKPELMNLLIIALCAALGGADSWVEVEEFGAAKLEFFRSFLDLPDDPQAIPRPDPFGKVLAALDAVALERGLLNWVAAWCEDLAGEGVALEGKTVRRSLDRRSGQAALHLVRAWASETGLVLGQVATDVKSKEITAIPELVERLDLTGATVTIDALGCQKEMAAKILAKKADYVLAVQDHQPNLHADVQRILTEAQQSGDPVGCRYHETIEKGHGRIETRKVWCTSTQGRLWLGNQDQDWPGRASLVRIEAQRTVEGKTTVEQRYYISSRSGTEAPAAKHLGHIIRQHWAVET
jgi:predicted transposase YbfD/YdcC